MEIAGDLIAATSKVTGLRAKAMLQFTCPAGLQGTQLGHGTRPVNRQFCGPQAGSANVRNGSVPRVQMEEKRSAASRGLTRLRPMGSSTSNN
jgi:hypothetical protein